MFKSVEQNKMEHKNGGGSSERPNLLNDVTTSSIIDEDPLDNDKIVGYPSSSSIHYEVDIGEIDTTFPEFEENDSTSVKSNPKSPSTTPKLSMIGTSPQAEGATLNDLNIYASPKQSPPIQVMGYDSNRIPSSIFAPKHRNDSEWSLASNESLFSIHMGNNSFSMDSGFYLSKSGELNWIDDYSCFTPDANKSTMSPGLPTVMDTSAENERKSTSLNGESGEKQEIIETQDVSPTDASRQSTNSFAFPVLAGGGSSPTKVKAEKPQPPSSTPQVEAALTTPKAPPTTPKAGGNQWFTCFSCFRMCC